MRTPLREPLSEAAETAHPKPAEARDEQSLWKEEMERSRRDFDAALELAGEHPSGGRHSAQARLAKQRVLLEKSRIRIQASRREIALSRRTLADTAARVRNTP